MKKILFITALLIGFLGSAQDSIVKAVSLKGRGPFLVKGSITGTTITGAQIVDSLNLELGSTEWQTGGGSSLPVDDTTALVQDPVDNTKTGLIDVGNVPTGTPATLSINGDNSFHDVLTITNTSSTIDPTLIFDKGPTMKDWALYAGSSGLGFYEETDVDSGVFGFTYVLRTGGNPIAGADLVDKTYADALNTDDQTAAEVPITDAAGYYTGTDVEAMGQEIGADIDFLTPDELTQAEFDALTTAEKKALGLYVIVPPAPSGYTVTIDNDPVLANGSDSFTWAGAEVGSFYDYSFTSSGGGTPVTGFGEIATATDQITDIDLSGLTDGTITLTAYLWNAGGDGSNATDTSTKTPSFVDVFPSGNAASAGANEADSTTGWTGTCSTSCVEVLSVANTDSEGSDFAISIEHIGGSESFRGATIDLTGLSLVPHTLTIRSRSVVGNTGSQGILLTNATSVTNNVDYSGTTQGDWFESTVVFTPTSSTVNFRIDVNSTGSGQGISGKIEVSEITLQEN